MLYKLRTVGDKSQNSFETESTLNFSGPYRRVRPAKLTNHSVRTVLTVSGAYFHPLSLNTGLRGESLGYLLWDTNNFGTDWKPSKLVLSQPKLQIHKETLKNAMIYFCQSLGVTCFHGNDWIKKGGFLQVGPSEYSSVILSRESRARFPFRLWFLEKLFSCTKFPVGQFW